MDLLSWISLPPVPMDQLVAMSCQLLCLISAFFYYHFLHIKNTSSYTRHVVSASIGVLVSILCYSSQSLHLFALCLVSYLLMSILPAPYRGWTVFFFCVTYVLTVHFYQYMAHYMSFPVEVSNSLMVMAMKASLTAFSLDDGQKEDSQLTATQKINKLKVKPTLFEYFCFCFCFLGLMFGPAYHLRDYRIFISGTQYKTSWQLARGLRVLAVSVTCLVFHVGLVGTYSPTYNLREEVMNADWVTRHAVLWFTMFISRLKYYFGWLSSEAICYLCGFGYDPDRSKEEEWGHGIPTVKIVGIEFATSLKVFADSWNIFTARWLQFCVYERVPYFKVGAVFALSAVWHGFYPGYYLMFLPLAFSIVLGRKLRRTLRPFFQHTKSSRRLYDTITWMATTLLIAFNSSAFELKAWDLIYSLQRSLYFWPHAVVLGLLVLTPSRKKVELAHDKPHANGNNNYHQGNGHTPRLQQQQTMYKDELRLQG